MNGTFEVNREMALPELIRKQAEAIFREFCHTPPAGRGAEPVYVLEGECITLFAEGGAGNAAVARFCFNRQLQQWTLHRPDPVRQWRFYPNAGPSLNLHKLLQHVADDPLRVFWPDPPPQTFT
jgi:hypothetical protein